MSTEPGGFVEAADGTLVDFFDLDVHAEALHTEVSDPVVLIHGLGCSWHHWSRQIGWLADARRVVAVDMRGSGKTRWTRPGRTTADMAADVHAVVAEVGLPRPAIVGCSMGGTIALRTRWTIPPTSAAWRFWASFASLPEEMAQVVERQRDAIKAESLREIAEERVGAAFAASADQGMRAWLVDMIAGSDEEEEEEEEGYESEAETTFAFYVRSRLGEIAVPAMIIHGDKDATMPVARAHEMAAGIPGATLHVMARRGPLRQRPGPGKGKFDPGQRARNLRGPCPEAVNTLTVPCTRDEPPLGALQRDPHQVDTPGRPLPRCSRVPLERPRLILQQTRRHPQFRHRPASIGADP